MKGFLSPKVRFDGLLLWLGVLACLFTASSFCGGHAWLFELTSHFRIQYGACLLGLTGYFCLKTKFRTAAFFAVFATLNLAVILPFMVGATFPKKTGAGVLRVLLLNVHTENERFDLVVRAVKNYKPDVAVFEEVNGSWLDELSPLREDYPNVKAQPRDDNFGIALFSRLPLSNAEIVYLGGAEVPSIVAQLEVKGRRLTLLGTHPVPPGSAENFRLRNEQLDAVATLVRNRTETVILVGDLNVTPWSYYFQRFVRDSGLSDAARGTGIYATWPANLLPLRIPIDHCLVSREIRVVKKVIGGAVGSDHLPVIVDLDLSPNRTRQE